MTRGLAGGRAGHGLAGLALLGALAGCATDSAGAESGEQASSGTGTATEVRLGYFPNLTHATGIVGVEQGLFTKELELANATPKFQVFDSGTEVIEAMLSGALDVSYIGPSPTLTGYAQSNGAALRVVSGAASGGAGLIVNPKISSVEDLGGTTLATPSLGNTQDVALRYFLKRHGYRTTTEGGGEVSVAPADSNSTIVQAFAQGDIDGAWVPEPYATQMEVDSGGERLVDEADLWPDGEFVTTQLIVRTDYLAENPEVVEAILRAHIQANEFIVANPEQAKQITNKALEDLTQTAIDKQILDLAWKRLEFTNDPIASSFIANAEHAEAVGLLEPIENLEGVYALEPLNKLLTAAGEKEVSGR